MGPRRPDWRHSQKEFRVGFVFLTRPGSEPAPDDLEAVERMRRAFGAHFFALTHGVAWADTTLASEPAAARSAVPDLDRAARVARSAAQGLDGELGGLRRDAGSRHGGRRSGPVPRGCDRPGLPARPRAGCRSSGRRASTSQSRAGVALATGSLSPPRSGRRAWPPPGRAERRRRIRRRRRLRERRARHGARAACHEGARPAGGRRACGQAVAALAVPGQPRRRLAGRPRGRDLDVVTAEVLLALLDWRESAGGGRAAKRRPRRAAGPSEPGRWIREQPEHASRDRAGPPGAPARGSAAGGRNRGDGVARALAARRRQLERERLPDRAGARGPAQLAQRQPRGSRRLARRSSPTPFARGLPHASRPGSATPVAWRRRRRWHGSTTGTRAARSSSPSNPCRRSSPATRRPSPSSTRRAVAPARTRSTSSPTAPGRRASHGRTTTPRAGC